MSGQGKKMDCTVCPLGEGKVIARHQGIVHLVETQFDERFAVWYGAVSVEANAEELCRMLDAREAIIILEDERQGGIRLMGSGAGHLAIIEGEAIGSEYNSTYFVGVSALAKPAK